MPDTLKQVVTVGVTGASGALLAQKALELLERDSRVARIHLVVTEAGQRLFAEELAIASGDLKQLPAGFSAAPRQKSNSCQTKISGLPSPRAATLWIR